MTYHIITISRQFGSGGRTIGKLVAERLGIPCYDAEIITKIAQDIGFTEDYIEERTESTQGGIFTALSEYETYGYSERIAIWRAQCRAIKELAEKGSCVFVGRCADYVLKGEDYELLKVFVCADNEARIERIIHEYGETADRPEKRLKDKDKRRKAYYEIYTDQKFGDPLNYDLCLNSARFGIDKCADIIVSAYKNE